MGKIEKLLDKTKRNGETKKWKMYVFAVVGILVIVWGFFGLMWIVDVDDYANSNSIVTAYDFYDLMTDSTDESIFVFGDSFVTYSIYYPLLNQLLNETGYTVYSLAQLGGAPLMYALQTQNVIDAHPSCVIMGVSYRHIADNSYGNYWIDERAYLVHDRLKINTELLNIYTEEQKKDILSPPSINYNKKFFISALENKLNGVSYPSREEAVYSKISNARAKPDIETLINTPRASMQHGIDEIYAAAKDPRNSFRAEITTETNQNKEALKYMIKTLQENGIKVIVLTACLNPVLSENISESSHQNLRDFLNSTGVSWYDMENSVEEKYFIDIYHINGEGASIFTPKVADIILKELT